YVRSNQDTSLFTVWRQAMPDKKVALLGLITVCMTALCALCIGRAALCEFEYQNANTNVLATLAYEVK
ncbi:Hok/Gef family protein, partial [Vibrio parahaemolyticus]|uniref:Hok/Gef family protein n=1 Tax=Vibrio parahaemolyticus TaxID=670 RepID=UPI000A5CD78B